MISSSLNKKANPLLWLFKIDSIYDEVTNLEKSYSLSLSEKRAIEYIFSRGKLRKVLSQILNLEPLSVPLDAKPGAPPLLSNNYGYVSISHCKDALLLGWSKSPIGVDIERQDRKFSYEKIVLNLFNDFEKKIISRSDPELRRKNSLKIWISKECIVKLTGISLLSSFNEWELHNDNLIKNSKSNRSYDFYHINILDWIIGITYKKQNNSIVKPLICF